VTVIQGICAAGYAILPFIIYKGCVYISAWYEETSIHAIGSSQSLRMCKCKGHGRGLGNVMDKVVLDIDETNP
jgi:hypothetical protein